MQHPVQVSNLAVRVQCLSAVVVDSQGACLSRGWW